MTTLVHIVHAKLDARDALDEEHVEALMDCMRDEERVRPRARHPYENIDKVDGDYDPAI